MNGMPGPGPVDTKRVDAFLAELKKSTGHLPTSGNLAPRTRELDRRIAGAGLSLAEKIAVFKRLAPSAEEDRRHAATGESDELRMERLLLSVAPEELSAFKFALEYGVDYKDVEEYLYHDIDDEARQQRIAQHLKKTPLSRGIKVLSDVDDTMYANFLEKRYRKGQFYPGVLEFYDAVKEELFGPMPAVTITTLSARPNPVAGHLEEASLNGLVQKTKERKKCLCPSGLSGAVVSSIVGSAEDLFRAFRHRRSETLETLDPDDHALADRAERGKDSREQADNIGRAKFANFARFAAVYPEYRYVFVGDSGQADGLTARLMLGDTSTEGASREAMSTEGTSRLITTFIHDLRRSENDTASASPAFRAALSTNLVVGRESKAGRGIIVFTDYIEAALIAYRHAATLGSLITADTLADVTRAALLEVKAPSFGAVDADRLHEQYRRHGEEAFTLLTAAGPTVAAAAKEIRQILDGGL